MVGPENNILDKDIDLCTGCGGCISICPNKAISFIVDIDGYYKAHIDRNHCVNCGKCKEICPKFTDFSGAQNHPRRMYCGKNSDTDIQYSSSSGGIVSAIARVALNEGYTVYGAWLDIQNRKLLHIPIKSVDELGLIRGSKYLQSLTVDALSKIKSEDKVLFIGTPCQIYALKKMYPEKDMILIDFRCAGTPGKNLIDKYFDYLYSFNKTGIKSINFRSKVRSWHIWGIECEYNDGSRYFKDKQHDPFGKVFSRYRDGIHDVCRTCGFPNQSYADIRVEDAWHQMNHVSLKDYKKGFSQIAVFTPKGETLFNKLGSEVCVMEVKNTFSEHSSSRRDKAGSLFYMLRNQEMSLLEIISKYENSLPFKDKVISYLSYVVSVNLYIYKACRFIYKSIRGGK